MMLWWSALKLKFSGTQLGAVHELELLGSEAAIQTLCNIVSDSSSSFYNCQEAAVSALGRIGRGRSDVVTALVDYAEEHVPPYEALFQVGWFEPAVFAPWANRDLERERPRLWRLLLNASEEGNSHLQQAAGSLMFLYKEHLLKRLCNPDWTVLERIDFRDEEGTQSAWATIQHEQQVVGRALARMVMLCRDVIEEIFRAARADQLDNPYWSRGIIRPFFGCITLAELGDDRAVSILLEHDRSGSAVNALSTLETILSDFNRLLSGAAIESCAALIEFCHRRVDYGLDERNSEWPQRGQDYFERLDCSRVRNAATEELSRRASGREAELGHRALASPKLLNTEHLESLIINDGNFISKMIADFIKTMDQQINDLSRDVEYENDHLDLPVLEIRGERCMKMAQEMKRACSYVGAESMAGILLDIERKASLQEFQACVEKIGVLRLEFEKLKMIRR